MVFINRSNQEAKGERSDSGGIVKLKLPCGVVSAVNNIHNDSVSNCVKLRLVGLVMSALV